MALLVQRNSIKGGKAMTSMPVAPINSRGRYQGLYFLYRLGQLGGLGFCGQVARNLVKLVCCEPDVLWEEADYALMENIWQQVNHRLREWGQPPIEPADRVDLVRCCTQLMRIYFH